MVDGGQLGEKLRASAIPSELRGVAQWVCWALEERDGKPTKVPINSRTGKHAATDRRATWTSFEEAVNALSIYPNLSGIGFVFSADDNFCGVDIDSCRKDGIVDQEAAKWSKHLGSYGEISQSGNGIHVILKGVLPGRGRKKGRYECYDQKRFFCMTGDRLLWCPETVEHRQGQLEEFHRAIFGGATSDKTILGPFFLAPGAEPPRDKFDALYLNDPQFAQAWDRTRRGVEHWSASEWDLSLAGRAAMAGWSDQEIVDLILAARRKHGDARKEHVQYYELTLRKARETLKSPSARVEQELGVAPGDVDAATVLEQISIKLGLPEGCKILRIEEYTGDPPAYSIKTQRGSVEIKTIAGLIDHGQLRLSIAQACKVVIRPFKLGNWDPIAQAILGSLETIDIGHEGHPLTRFSDLVDEFVEQHPLVTEDWQGAAFRHQPFILDGRVHISLRGVIQFLHANVGERIRETEAVRSLRKIGWTPGEDGLIFRFHGRRTQRRTWSRPFESGEITTSRGEFPGGGGDGT